MKNELRKAKEDLSQNPDVTLVSKGFRFKQGKRTDEECIVVGVKKKLSFDDVPGNRLIVPFIAGKPTDVIDAKIYAPPPYDPSADPQALIQKRRACPPGYSIGHYLITAGTLGFYAHHGADENQYVYSNNHVLANSNDAQPNDEIRQQAKYDGGTSSENRFALLKDFVKINFDGDKPKKGPKSAAAMLWAMWKWPPNRLARALGCPYRLRVSAEAIEQPHPNRVDLAWALPVLQSYVDLEFPFGIGELNGIRDLVLGDRVQKVGRTTEHTFDASVVGIDTMTRVQYANGIATYDGQLTIKADVGEFSAGGDSGSAVLTEDGFLGGLLFAGGSGITIANPIRDVISFGGVHFPTF